MNKTELKKLLTKDSWTGKEVGQAYLHKMLSENTGDTPIFSTDQLGIMQESLVDPNDIQDYQAYYFMYAKIKELSEVAEGHIQQFYSGYYRYLYTLRDCKQADQALKAVESYPMIMTRTQADRIKTELLEKRKAAKTCFYNIIIDYIDYMIEHTEQAPNEIKAEIEATKTQNCTNRRLLINYTVDVTAGYYTLPDGTRSDKVPPKEWNAKARSYFIQEAKKRYKRELAELDRSATDEEIYNTCKQAKETEVKRLFFEGVEGVKAAFKKNRIKEKDFNLSPEDIVTRLDEYIAGLRYSENEALIDALTCSEGITWHETDTLKEITKYEILKHLYFNNGDPEDIETVWQKEEFARDFPALYQATVRELKKLLPSAATLTENEYMIPLFSYGELSKALGEVYGQHLAIGCDDILDYYFDGREADTLQLLQNRHRLIRHGLAIIEEDSRCEIAENGDYIESQHNPYSLLESLDSIAKDPRRRGNIQVYNNLLISKAFRFVYAYNMLVDALAYAYDVKELSILKKNTKYQEDISYAFNEGLYDFYANVYGSEKDKERKRTLIKQTFEPIKVETEKPSNKVAKETKRALVAAFSNGTYLRVAMNLRNLLDEILDCEKGV